MQSVLITGATGFIGRNLVNHLANQGCFVHAIYRKGSLPILTNCNLAQHFLENADDLDRIFRKEKINTVIHLATSYTQSSMKEDVASLIECNIVFGVRLLEAMNNHGCTKLLNITTYAEFDQTGSYSPNSLYAASKKAFRDLCDYYTICQGLTRIDLALYDNYGPNDPRNKIINNLCNASITGHSILLSPGKQLLNLVHISDTVRALQIANQMLNDIPSKGDRFLYCVAPSKPISLKKLVTIIEAVSSNRINAVWGAIPYRNHEALKPWRGPMLPGWKTKLTLAEGISTLLKESRYANHAQP